MLSWARRSDSLRRLLAWRLSKADWLEACGFWQGILGIGVPGWNSSHNIIRKQFRHKSHEATRYVCVCSLPLSIITCFSCCISHPVTCNAVQKSWAIPHFFFLNYSLTLSLSIPLILNTGDLEPIPGDMGY